MPDPSNPVARVLATLRELGGITGECSVPLSMISDLADIGRTHTRTALKVLEADGRLVITRSSDGVTPSTYRVVTPSTNSDPVQSDPGHSPIVTPSTVACARDRSEPFSSLSASDNGDRRAHAGAPARARLGGDNPTQEPTVPQPNAEAPSQVAIIAAVDACRIAGKPPLDEAAKKRIGSVAKRMHAGGVTLEEVRSAAVYLAQHGMSDLQAAHRSRLERDAGALAGSDLADRAAASKAERAGVKRHKVTLDELAELFDYLRQTWPRHFDVPDRAEFWLAELAPFPIDFLLGSARQWSRRTDGQGAFPPTVGQLYAVTRRNWGDALLQEKIERERLRVEAEVARKYGDAPAGDSSDPRAE